MIIILIRMSINVYHHYFHDKNMNHAIKLIDISHQAVKLKSYTLG